MKTTFKFIQMFLLATFIVWGCAGIGQDPDSNKDIYYYGVEMSGVLCGYSESEKTYFHKEENPVIEVKDDIFIKLTVLGQGMDIRIKNEYLIDSLSGRFTYCKHTITTGTTMVGITEVIGNTIFFRSAENEIPKEFELTPDLILESPISNNHIVKDFIHGQVSEKDYMVFDDMKGEIVKKTYVKLREEDLELAGVSYNTTVFEELNHSTGAKSTMWFSNDGGFLVKLSVAGRTVYLADESVKKRIKIADMDNVLFAKVNKVIPDIHNITYMKVRAKIESAGEWIDAESLSFNGQTFTGTVIDNFINGTFELRSIRYDGQDSPGLPYDFPIEEDIKEYIEPGNLIESDEPELIAEAKSITEGAENSWEAVKMLSRWVGENIHGAIPGGTSAINTYRTREGECGSHSRLLAGFCRAVGIPARLSIGCMYSTYLGGSFGQHAWTQVYMGDAGWIAVDATANQYDFVDAGHIRLGEGTSFNPKEMEILEYEIRGQTPQEMDNQIPEIYSDFIGKYQAPEHNKTFEVLYQDGSLAVDIPNKMILALNDADEDGLYYPTITRQVNFQFIRDTLGNVEDMRLQQIIPIPRKAEQDSSLANANPHPHPQVGNYSLPQAKIEISIFVREKGLVINDPITDVEAKIEQDVASGMWDIRSTNNQLQFEEDENGNVKNLLYYENIFFRKEINDEI